MDQHTYVDKLLQNSELSQKEAVEFSGVLSVLNGNELETIIELFEEDKVWILTLYTNFKQKEHALGGNDESELQKIFESEKEKVASLGESLHME